ncbi:MAG TPA: nucleotidyltransferase domain-containing protein [Acidimicrobiales bacterium]|nr:nucleotidyltransferase domain-containing protein [Acidimicrobiales bacterium]
MAAPDRQVRAGKATYGGRALSEWVPDVVDRLVERFAPRKVVLFGSVARGDDGPDSDIDVLVVLDRLEGRHHDAVIAMLRSLTDLPVPVDVVVTDVAEIEDRARTPGIVRFALQVGVALHG